MKRIIIILLISIISQNSISSQYLKDKKILIVWGGYKPHQPKLFTKIVSDWLKTQKAYISESNDLGIYSNYIIFEWINSYFYWYLYAIKNKFNNNKLI